MVLVVSGVAGCGWVRGDVSWRRGTDALAVHE